MATAAQTGWRVPCPHCGAVADDDGDGGLVLRLADLEIHCPSCDEQVREADLRRLIDDAQRLLRWLEMAKEV